MRYLVAALLFFCSVPALAQLNQSQTCYTNCWGPNNQYCQTTCH